MAAIQREADAAVDSLVAKLDCIGDLADRIREVVWAIAFGEADMADLEPLLEEMQS